MQKLQERTGKLVGRMNTGAKWALLMIILFAAFLIPAYAVISPEQYDLKAGDVAPATITATRDIVDQAATARRRESAAEAVSKVYYKDESVADSVMADLEKAFGEVRAVRELGAQIRQGWNDSESNYADGDYQQASGLLSMLSLSNYQLRTLMNTSESDLETLYQSLTSATRTALVSSINEGQVDNAIASIQQIVAYNTRTDLWYSVGMPVLRACLRPNMIYDQEATEINRVKASDSVEQVIYKQGQNIVVKGDRVTEEQISVLEEMGVIKGDSPEFVRYLSTAVLIAVLLLGTFLIAMLFRIEKIREMKTAIVCALCSFIAAVLSLFASSYGAIGMMPIVLAAMLVVNLIGEKPAYLVNTFVSLFLAFTVFGGPDVHTDNVLAVLIMGFVGGTLSIYLIKKNPSRTFVLGTGCIVGVLNIIVLICTGVFISSNPLKQVFFDSLNGMVGSLVAAIVCVGLQPVLETAFNLVTTAKLIELANPNQPLMRRLMLETPGTYHHSMIVANLAEAAADEVGGNALLVRVGAYYHDIGKLVRPQFFKENQVGENPHDKTEPQVSAAILTEHIRDGVELARKNHLPEQIIDLIQQHHGTTPVMYFYVKAVNALGEENVNIEDYRYEGPKPQSKEAAILMLADTCEAAIRTLQEPTREKMQEMIRKLVKGKVEDGQLEESPLTFHDIGRICMAFETVLQGVYHERIEYPEIKNDRNHSGQKKKKVPDRENISSGN